MDNDDDHEFLTIRRIAGCAEEAIFKERDPNFELYLEKNLLFTDGLAYCAFYALLLGWIIPFTFERIFWWGPVVGDIAVGTKNIVQPAAASVAANVFFFTTWITMTPIYYCLIKPYIDDPELARKTTLDLIKVDPEQFKAKGFKFDLGDYNMYEEIDDLKDVFNMFKKWFCSYFIFKIVVKLAFNFFTYIIISFYIYVFCNIFLLFFIIILFVFFNLFNRNKNFVISNNFLLYFINTKKFIYFLKINLLLLFFSVLYYINNFYNNVYNFNYVKFFKKVYIINFNLDYVFNIDYISFYFIILTIFIFFIIYATFLGTKFKNDTSIKLNNILFLFLIIEFLLILTFSTSNIFFFFFFFECSLLPMYMLIIILGKGVKKKHFSALYLVFYTLLGSIFLLFGILYLIVICNFCDFKQLNFELIDFNSQIFLFFLFFLGFSVKVPIFPFYSWLPEAHVEASTSVSILLASIFLKVATYGFLKIIVFNFYLINYYYYSVIFYFCLISIFLATFLNMMQTDLKKIIALSSIIHMNYMVIALFSLEPKSIFASFIYMFSHAFVSSGLFYLIGILYENNGTRDILNYNNVLKYNSKFFYFFIFFNLSNISFPLTLSFIAELILLNNLIYLNILILILLLISIIFSVIYTFWIIHNVLFGKYFLKKNSFLINKFDLYFLNILFIIIFILGLIPFLAMFNLEQEIYILLINKLNIY